MSDWKPIETAPRDGTALLLYAPDVARCSDNGVGGVVVGWFESDFGRPSWVCDMAQLDGYDDDLWLENEEVAPTHWMPLPDPPEPD